MHSGASERSVAQMPSETPTGCSMLTRMTTRSVTVLHSVHPTQSHSAWTHGSRASSRDSSDALGVASGSADCDSDGDDDALARGDALDDDALSDALALADASTRG